MTIDDIRKFAAADPEAFAAYLLEDGWRWDKVTTALHFQKKYAQTLRDQFAIAALPGLIAQAEAVNSDGWSWRTGTLAGDAYAFADDMLSARGEG